VAVTALALPMREGDATIERAQGGLGAPEIHGRQPEDGRGAIRRGLGATAQEAPAGHLGTTAHLSELQAMLRTMPPNGRSEVQQANEAAGWCARILRGSPPRLDRRRQAARRSREEAHD
jgi:hypothetical protein